MIEYKCTHRSGLRSAESKSNSSEKVVQIEPSGEPSCFLFIGDKRYYYTDMGGVIR